MATPKNNEQQFLDQLQAMAEQFRFERFARLMASVQKEELAEVFADMLALVTPPTAPTHDAAHDLSERTIHQFADREQRRADRLLRAAWSVGGAQARFRALTRAEQVEKVRVWVEAAQQHAADRRAGIAAP